MKRILTSSVMALALTLSVAAPAAFANSKTKHSAAHNAAVQKCSSEYGVAMKEARTKKGSERTSAISAAKAARKQCLAEAPK